MARLTTTDKQMLEKLFGMESGYVLNFSDRTFAEFFRDDMNIDIYNSKFMYASGSKANRMRGFWIAADDALVAKSIDRLLRYIDVQIALSRLRAEDHPKNLIENVRSISQRLTGQTARNQTTPSDRDTRTQLPSSDKIQRLSLELFKLQALGPQQRGFAFERFLYNVFDTYLLQPRGPFRLTGEQIDGSFQLNNDVFLLEAKWQNQPTGQADLLAFSGKVEGKAQWSRGVFVSYTGFTSDGLEAFARGKSTRIICVDGLDLHSILTYQLSFEEVIHAKLRRAGETNQAYVSVRELFPFKVP